MKKSVSTAAVVGAAIVVLSIAASAQENKSEISIQGAGFFTSGVSGNGTSYGATESAGAIGTYRYHLNHWVSVEAAYGFDMNTQKFNFLTSNPFRVQTDRHQFTGSLVMNLPTHGHSRINPYVLLGAGALLFDPTGNQANTISNAQAQTKGAFVYGLGVNYAVHKGIALRAEYRGLVYSNPDFGFGALSTGAVTQTAEPSIGISFRF